MPNEGGVAGYVDRIGISYWHMDHPKAMERFLEISPGLVSVLGLMNDTDNRVQLPSEYRKSLPQ